MPRHPHYAYVVPMRRRRGPLLVAIVCALLAFITGTGLGLGVLAAAAVSAVAGGLTYSLATRE